MAQTYLSGFRRKCSNSIHTNVWSQTYMCGLNMSSNMNVCFQTYKCSTSILRMFLFIHLNVWVSNINVKRLNSYQITALALDYRLTTTTITIMRKSKPLYSCCLFFFYYCNFPLAPIFW